MKHELINFHWSDFNWTNNSRMSFENSFWKFWKFLTEALMECINFTRKVLIIKEMNKIKCLRSSHPNEFCKKVFLKTLRKPTGKITRDGILF